MSDIAINGVSENPILMADTIKDAASVIKSKGGRTDYVKRLEKISDAIGLLDYFSRKHPNIEEIPKHVAHVMETILPTDEGIKISEIAKNTKNNLTADEVNNAIDYLNYHRMIKISENKIKLKTVGDRYLASEAVEKHFGPPYMWAAYEVNFGLAALLVKNTEYLQKEISGLNKYIKKKFGIKENIGFLDTCKKISECT